MMKTIDLSEFSPKNVTPAGETFTFAVGGGSLTLPAYEAKAGQFLVMDVTDEEDISFAMTWTFRASDGRYIAFKMGLLPHLRTRIALPMNNLDGSILFLPRTPGKLKTVTQGRPLPLADVSSFSLWAGDSLAERKLSIHAVRVADEEPDYPVPDTLMVDSLGQKKCSEWQGKTHGEEELKAYLNDAYENRPTSALPDRSRFGGWTKKRFEPTGWFALRHDGRRYWLADPDGYAFFSMGLDCVCFDGDCNLTGITKLCENLPPRGTVGWSTFDRGDLDFFSFHVHNLYTGFGADYREKWSDLTAARMESWGFNTIACWSDLDHAVRVKQPYTFIFSGHPRTSENLFRDFPDVFSPEYAKASEKWAKQLKPFADDPYLLGYFMGNEPQWAFVNDLNLAALLLSSEKRFASTERLIGSLAEKYQTIAALNEAWGTDFDGFRSIRAVKYNETAAEDLWAFTAEMIREYMRVPAEAIRRVDSHHLNLGIRYAWMSSKVLASGSEYVDVFSFNCYKLDPTDLINDFYEKVKKPLIIGEFHFGALDAGLDATGLRGVTSQSERGAAYRRYMQKSASHPMCLGAHYFTLNDQAYLGRFDGENYQIGVVDVCQRPYEGFVKGIIETNRELYEIADGKKPADARLPEEIPAVAF